MSVSVQGKGGPEAETIQLSLGNLFADPILVEIASEDVNGELVPLKVEHANQFLFGKGLIRIDRQRGRYGEDFLMTYGVENGHYKGYSK